MEVRINTWQDFEATLDRHTADAQHGACWFRGQTQDWLVEPSLARRVQCAAEETAVSIESGTSGFFIASAHDHLPDNQYGYLRTGNHPVLWWTVMQHHGCPTRLIDWTFSPYVALYYACNENLDKDGVVFCFDSMRYFDVLKERHRQNKGTYTIEGQDYFEAFLSALNSQNPPQTGWTPQAEAGMLAPPSAVPDIVWTAVARFADSRITAQQGGFTVGNRVICNHWDVVGDVLGDKAVKIIVPAFLKPVFVPRLRTMNIHGLSLFPDLNGLCRYALERAWFPNLSRAQT